MPTIDLGRVRGADGVGVPTGGNAGQILTKASNANHDTKWVDIPKVEVDSTLKVSGKAADAKVTGDALGQLSGQMVNYRTAVNLLDNGAFQIAQAGYGGYHGTQKFAADRWECHAGLVVSKVADGLEISATSDSYDGLWQYINIDTDKYNGKSLTAAVSVNGFLSVIVERIGESTTKPANAINSVEMKLDLESSKPYIQINVKSGYTAVINWVALYEGEFTAETLPSYVPKGYANELLACEVAEKGNIFGMELLWQNGSPGSEYPAHNEQVIIAEYDYVLVEYRTSINANQYCAIMCKNQTGGLISFCTGNNQKYYSREFNIGVNVFYFSDAYANGVVSNWYCVPTQIWGIKGVEA